MKIIITATLLLIMVSSCKKEHVSITLRQLIFKEEADTAIQFSKNYSAYPATKRISLFNDQFNNNTNGWPIIAAYTYGINSNVYSKISNGIYELSGESDPQNAKYYFFSIIRNVDTTKNFEIEIRILAGANQKTTSFAFGSEITNNTLNGTFIYVQNTAASQQLVVDNATNSTTFASTALGDIHNYHVITIRKINTAYLYFTNGVYLGLTPYYKFSGSKIGFYTQPAMKIDYLKIDYLTL